MNMPRRLLSTCIGIAAACCVLSPLLSSGSPARPQGSRINPADPSTGDRKNVSLPDKAAVTAADHTAPFQVFSQRPLSFERNVGQSNAGTEFVSRGAGYSLALGSEGAVLSIANSENTGRGLGGRPAPAPIFRTTALRMSLVGTNRNAEITGIDPSPDKVNYLMGNDPKHWHLHVPHYARVKYQAVSPGIDLVYYGNQRQLEYDFIVAPGADPSQIRLSFDGTESLRLDPMNGDLVVTLANGAELRHQRPVIYQMGDGKKENIAGSYSILDQKDATFALGSYDPRKSLVIDPTLDFTTTFGGSLENFPLGIAVDNEGNAYVTGYTDSTDFPQVGTGLGTLECTSSSDAVSAAVIRPRVVPNRVTPDATATTTCNTPFVTKISPKGIILFSTYFGGFGGAFTTLADGIAADSTGAFITGATSAPNFLSNAKYAFGSSNAFVALLDPSGDFFHWVVGLGGGAAAVSVCNPPTTGPCTELLYNAGTGIALDAQHNAYISGYTTAIDFPTTEYFEGQHKSWQPVYGANACTTQSPLGFCENGFAAKLPSTGNFDDGGYSTYIGGSVFDTANAVAVDGTGHAFVTGLTYSPDFPAFASTAGLAPEGGGYTGFVTKLQPDGSGPVYSYFLGGHEDLADGDGPPIDSGYGIAVDFAGHAYVTGETCSPNFPTTPGAAQTVASVYCSTTSSATSFNNSGFVSVFSPVGALMYSTLFGGPGPTGSQVAFTEGQAITLNPRDEVYVGGYTSALNILGNPNPLQNANENTGIVIKFSANLSHADFVNYIGTGVTGVAVQPLCPGIRCIIESILFGYQIYAVGYTFPPGTDVNNFDNLKVFVSKWTDDAIVVPPGLRQ